MTTLANKIAALNNFDPLPQRWLRSANLNPIMMARMLRERQVGV